MLISTARAQPFGGAPAEGADGSTGFVVNVVLWALVIALVVAIAWPALKWIVKGGRR